MFVCMDLIIKREQKLKYEVNVFLIIFDKGIKKKDFSSIFDWVNGIWIIYIYFEIT